MQRCRRWMRVRGRVTMKRSTVYACATIVVLIALVWLFFGRAAGSSSSAGISETGAGDYQKVVLSIKNGNYYPNTITVSAGKPVRIYLDGSVQGCYRSFLIPSFGVQKFTPGSQDYAEFTPTTTGTYGFRCGMGMGHGTLVVK